MLYDSYEKEHSKKGFLELMEKGTVVAPCVYDCVSAKMVEQAGFPAMCLSGGELAASLVGVPDIGLVTLDELVGVVERISSCTSIPMIVDIDTGFGNELNLIRTCKRIAQAGAKAVHLEDQTFPKRCGHLGGKEVIPRAEYISKIKAAHSVLKGTDCLLIARTDSYHIPGMGVEEAIRRNLESREAGADITFTEGTGSYEDIEKVAKVVEKRAQDNKGFTIIAIAEGAMSKEEAKMKKKEREAKRAAEHYSASADVSRQLVELVGVEPRGRGPKLGDNAASITYGKEGVMHGFNSIMLKDENGDPAPVYSVASGLDYPSSGPEHAFLHDLGRVKYDVVNDEETIDAFFELSKMEGIIPAIESSHAVAYAMKLAKTMGKGSVLINLSGRGDKDMDYVIEKYGIR